MSAHVKAVFFDWAGTMVDFGSCAPVIAMQRVFEAAGVPVSESAVRAHMGKAKREHVLAMFADQTVSAEWRAAKGRLPDETDADHLMIALEPAMAREAAKASTLIPGAKQLFDQLVANGIRVGSSTGYTRTMMAAVADRATEQGYRPETILCSGDTPQGRPAPFMLWQAMITLNVWPSRACVAIDDAPVGIAAGREAGMWTIGLAGSGNEMGLSANAYFSLGAADRRTKLQHSATGFQAAGADFVVATVADVPRVLAIIDAQIAKGALPGAGTIIDTSFTQ